MLLEILLSRMATVLQQKRSNSFLVSFFSLALPLAVALNQLPTLMAKIHSVASRCLAVVCDCIVTRTCVLLSCCKSATTFR
jgi:hypothetical protein